MTYRIKREDYVKIYGPTVGDKIRLADTDLIIEIEKDYTVYGEECKFGAGKNIRDGMSQNQFACNNSALDLVITNVVIIDWWGIVKGDIGIKDGKIVGIGKAGNPNVMDGVTPNMVIGPSTDVISGEGLIATAGAIDTHVHFICPQQIETALYKGITTLIGGGIGPTEGTKATTCTPGVWNIFKMLKAVDNFPVNIGLTGKGNSSYEKPLIEQVKAGVVGFKIHEDWGATPTVIDTCLKVADEFDVQVALHTDSMNEAGFVEDTIKAIGNRVLHAYHVEGAGGGHAPDVLKVVQYKNIIPSSTTPTMPHTINTFPEHLDMLIFCHHLDKNLEEDVEFAKARIRETTMAAEDYLHDIGAISIINSDSQAMGRIGEVITRTWQTADKMKKIYGRLPEDTQNDNYRVKRYISKYTINPAIAHGISQYIGSLEPGKIADIVLWKPAFFGVKPEMIIKGGFIIASKMGDANASIPTPQPVIMKKMFGAFGKAVYDIAVTFVSGYFYENEINKKIGINKKVLPVKNCRNISKENMIYNNQLPKIEIDYKTFEVFVNGNKIDVPPAVSLSMTRRYNLF